MSQIFTGKTPKKQLRVLPPPRQESIDRFADAAISLWIAWFTAAKWAVIALVIIGIPTLTIYSVRWATSTPIHREVCNKNG